VTHRDVGDAAVAAALAAVRAVAEECRGPMEAPN
jgi:hypothetical protein